jgi:hypothetical protein
LVRIFQFFRGENDVPGMSPVVTCHFFFPSGKTVKCTRGDIVAGISDQNFPALRVDGNPVRNFIRSSVRR